MKVYQDDVVYWLCWLSLILTVAGLFLNIEIVFWWGGSAAMTAWLFNRDVVWGLIQE